MSEDIYEVLSLGMRYWFMVLGILIVWRAFSWLRKDRREKHRRLRQLPDAGMIGELVVIVGSDELPEGSAIPVPQEGVLGFLRTCDVVVPVPGVAPHHLDFTFRDGKGLLLRPWRGCTCQVDANEITHRTKVSRYPMHHGSKLFVGDAVLRLRVFAGLNVDRHVAYTEDKIEEPAPQEAPVPQPDWQEYEQQQPYCPAPPYQQPYPPQPVAPNQDWLNSGYPQCPPSPMPYQPQSYQQPDPPPSLSPEEQVFEPLPEDHLAQTAPRTRRGRRWRHEA